MTPRNDMGVVTDILQALARAIYSRPELAIFDDPFSSLDHSTAEAVFNRVFSKKTGLLRQWETTIVLVTQAAKFLPDADKIIALRDGCIAEQGSFHQLARAGGYVESLCHETSAQNGQDRLERATASREHIQDASKPKTTPTSPASPTDKRRQRGDFSVYAYFFSTLGWHSFTTLLICEASWTFLSAFPTVWLNWWANANAEEPNQRIGYYLGVYACLQVMAVICFGTLMLIGMYFIASRVGFRLHQRLLDAVMRFVSPLHMLSMWLTMITEPLYRCSRRQTSEPSQQDSPKTSAFSTTSYPLPYWSVLQVGTHNLSQSEHATD